MNVVVTGATGHVGNNLVRRLLEQDERVRVLVYPTDSTRSIEGLPVERVEGDVTNPDSLLQAFEGADVVYHVAGIVSIVPGREELLRRVNVRGTRNVVEACIKQRVRRLVYIASIHALVEPAHGTTIDERMAFDPERIATEYGRSKAQAAREVLKGVDRGLDAVIACPTGIIGPHDFQPSVVGKLLIDAARRRLPAYVSGGYDFVDVRDVAWGLMAICERGRTGDKYIFSGEYIAVCDLLGLLEELTGVRAPRICLPAKLAKAVAATAPLYMRLLKRQPPFTPDSLLTLASNAQVSHEKATRELGYSPRPLEESVADTLRWFRAVGMLRLPHDRRIGSQRLAEGG